MRLAVLLCLLSAPVLAQDYSGTTRRTNPETQLATQPPPTNSCLDPVAPQGLDLRSVRGYRVGVEPVVGGTLSAGFVLRAYYWDFVAGKWARGPMSDITMTEGGTGMQWSPDMAVLVKSGCVYYAAEAVGTGVVVRITAWTGGA